MSFRPHGEADISPSFPMARGVCDRCGRVTNHHKLKWQYDWAGTKLQNKRVLCCSSCLDEFQPNGQRTIILPPDPVPVMNARPEQYVPDDNPLSAIGANPSPARWKFGGQIGNMVNAGGVPAAFDGNANKPSFMSAMISVSNSSFNNYVGINWSGAPASITPSSLNSPVLTHTVSKFTITAPNNATFGSTAYVVQGSQVDAGWGSWTTIASGNPVGSVGEVITGIGAGGRYQFHRAAFYGSATGSDFNNDFSSDFAISDQNSISVAQVQFFVSDRSSI